MEPNGEEITVTKAEKERIQLSSARCPFLNAAPLIPFAEKYYFYCDIQFGKNVKRGVVKSYIATYCCNEGVKLAFSSCDIWLESPSENINN